MNRKIIYFTVFLIIILASILRLWRLGTVPPSPDWDEVALGYNAYSIMLTGKDEYGKTFPIILRSFDDYKPALYVYFVMPFIKLFDVTTFAVRLPSAIFGIITVLGTFLLVKELCSLNGRKDNNGAFIFIPLLTTFLLAISPWHIQFSRIAFESNVGLAFNIFATLLFLRALRQPWLLPVSAVLMGLNLYVYQSEKVFTPLLLLGLIAIFRKSLFASPKKYLILAMILGVLVSLPIIHYTITEREALSRASGVSVFADKTPFLQENVKRLIQDKEANDYLGMILDNRRIVYVKAIVTGYLSHFDLNWLFIRGDIARHHAPNVGLLYLWELPLMPIGIYGLIFGNFSVRVKALVIFWFLIVPIPASITSGVPHAVRTLNFLPTFQIFTSIGLLTILRSIVNSKYKIVNIHLKYSNFLILFIIFSFFIFNFVYYLNQYFVQQNYFHSQDWQYGYEEAIDKVKEVENRYKKIVVSNQPHLDQSYMFFLFYLKYPPDMYQKESKFASGGFRETHKFGKFEFRPIDFNNERKGKETLFIGRPFDFPQNDLGHVKTVNFLDGSPAIKFVERL